MVTWSFQNVLIGETIGAAVAGFFFVLVGIGSLSGFIGRVILLVTHQWLKKTVDITAIGVLSFFSVPLILCILMFKGIIK